MPLQIRRGTDTERLLLAVPLANGELLWTTDTKKLFVGDGNTLAKDLTAVINYNDTDAQRAAGALLAGSTTTDINFTYNASLNTLTTAVDISVFRQDIDMGGFSLTGSGNINIDGDLRATGKLVGNYSGSLFGDDSTLLVDGVNSVIVGPINSSNIRGTFIGNVIGNVEGYHTGDVQGSVFSDGSTLLVDSVDGLFYGTLRSGDSTYSNRNITSNPALPFEIGTPVDPMDLGIYLSQNLQIYNSYADLGGYITSTMGRGSHTAPEAVQQGDELGGVRIKAFTDGTTKAQAGSFTVFVDPTATIAGGDFIKSKLLLSACTDVGQELNDGFLLDSAGVATSNVFSANKFFQLPVYADDAARLAAIPTPAAGMMIFMTSGTTPAAANKMQLFDGSNWINLN